MSIFSARFYCFVTKLRECVVCHGGVDQFSARDTIWGGSLRVAGAHDPEKVVSRTRTPKNSMSGSGKRQR